MAEQKATQSVNASPVVTVSARAQWNGGVQSVIKVRNFSPFVADEPTALGGADQGPNPMEYVLGGLVSCLVVMVRLIAGEQEYAYSDLKVAAHGDIDTRGLFGAADVVPYFTTVWGKVELESTESAERLNGLCEQVEKRCPAYNLLKAAGVEPQFEWKITQP